MRYSIDTFDERLSELLEGKECETLQAEAETLQAGAETLQAEGIMPKRMLRDEMIQKIVAFCTEWRTAEEIAVFLHRSKRYITNEVLPKMDNLLERLYPQVRRHPDQKYRVKKKNNVKISYALQNS